ncbi:MAG: hypothetical protein JO347_01580 [Candidatus Eremiobacteraeota bacterium]|nr:hypothetical protein [Candidatus Eremiobacteraeota bacterium]
MLAASFAIAGCSKSPAPTYKAGAVPGIDRAALETAVGKPSSSMPFALPGLKAEILAYPFGQAVLQDGKVAVVTIASDPAYTGAHGIHLGMPEDEFLKALHGTGAKGHRDAYDVIAGDMDTRTKDYYDEHGSVMYELAAANANDPLAPYNVIGINLADASGLSFLETLTKDKVAGLYTGQHIDNFVSDPWSL